MSEQNKDFTRISRLPDAEKVNPTDLFMVSQAGTQDDQYTSRKMEMGKLMADVADQVKEDLHVAADVLSAVSRVNSFEELRQEEHANDLVPANIVYEAYTRALAGCSETGGGTYLDRSCLETPQDVCGDVHFDGRLCCVTPGKNKLGETTPLDPKSVVNYDCLSTYVQDNGAPFIGDPSTEEEYTATGSEDHFIIGVEENCVVNIRMYSPSAAYVGIATYCVTCQSETTYEGRKAAAERDNKEKSMWHIVDYGTFSAKMTLTDSLPFKGNHMLMVYNMSKGPASISNDDMLGVDNRKAFPNGFKMIVTKYS